jgi:glycosyltransferase involved in cell wall biosynthesis
MSKLLSIIIVTKNEEKNIARLLDSIFRKNEGYSSILSLVEVILVDNPTTSDKTLEIVSKYPVQVFQKGPERSAQRNFGAENAAGEFLMFLDADMEMSDALLAETLERLSKHSGESLGFIIPERIPGKSIYCKARNLEKIIYTGNNLIEAARVYPRGVFQQIGGFNPKMISGEDWDLDRRLRQAGVRFERTSAHLNHHEEDLGIWGSVSKKIYYARKIINYKIGVNPVVNPFYRYRVLFSKPKIILKAPLVFAYLIFMKTMEFGVGFVIYKTRKLF